MSKVRWADKQRSLTKVAGLRLHLLVVSVEEIELNQASRISREHCGDNIRVRKCEVARSHSNIRRESGRTRSSMSMNGATSLHWDARHDSREEIGSGSVIKFRSVKGLATSSQGGRETKVAHSTSARNEPGGGSHRRDGPSLFDNPNVDIVPAIINRSPWDRVGIYRDTGECESENQGEESDHGGHFSPAENMPIGCEDRRPVEGMVRGGKQRG